MQRRIKKDLQNAKPQRTTLKFPIATSTPNITHLSQQKLYIEMNMNKNKKNMIRVGFEPTPLARPGNYC